MPAGSGNVECGIFICPGQRVLLTLGQRLVCDRADSASLKECLKCLPITLIRSTIPYQFMNDPKRLLVVTGSEPGAK